MTKPEDSDNGHDLPTPNPYQTHPAQRARISMIATPIGNLSDISYRAEEVFNGVSELWCEDTRHTQALLNALSIGSKKLRRVDQHTSPEELRRLLAQVEAAGQWIGVVTDAGTPGLSDPGSQISDLISGFPDIRLEPIPGASALSAFVSIAGLTGNTFSFQGFFPRSASEATGLLNDLKEGGESLNWIFFESPNRILETVSVLATWSKELDFKPKFIFAKELTKIHETIYAGTGEAFLQWLQAQGFDERGEWVLAVVLPKNYVKMKKDQADWEVTLECLIEAGISTKDASQIIVGRFSVAKNLAYKVALEMSKKIKK